MCYITQRVLWTKCGCEHVDTQYPHCNIFPDTRVNNQRVRHTQISERVINHSRCVNHEAEWNSKKEYRATGRYLDAAEIYNFYQSVVKRGLEAIEQKRRITHEKALWNSNRSLIITNFILLAYCFLPLLSIGFSVWLTVAIGIWFLTIILIYFLVDQLAHPALINPNILTHAPLLVVNTALTLYCIPFSFAGIGISIMIISTAAVEFLRQQTRNRCDGENPSWYGPCCCEEGTDTGCCEDGTGSQSPDPSTQAAIRVLERPTDFPFLDHNTKFPRQERWYRSRGGMGRFRR